MPRFDLAQRFPDVSEAGRSGSTGGPQARIVLHTTLGDGENRGLMGLWVAAHEESPADSHFLTAGLKAGPRAAHHTLLVISDSEARMKGDDATVSPGPVPEVEVDDAVVLVLGGPSKSPELEGRVAGITRLEKLVYLLKNETDIGNLITEDPEFRAYNFGPFSSKIYQAIDTLRLAGLVTDSDSPADSPEDAWETRAIIGEDVPDPYTTRNFELTDRGKKYYRALVRELPRDTERKLQDFKDAFAGLPLRRLVRYVYQRYPDMTENSIIRDEVLGR